MQRRSCALGHTYAAVQLFVMFRSTPAGLRALDELAATGAMACQELLVLVGDPGTLLVLGNKHRCALCVGLCDAKTVQLGLRLCCMAVCSKCMLCSRRGWLGCIGSAGLRCMACKPSNCCVP